MSANESMMKPTLYEAARALVDNLPDGEYQGLGALRMALRDHEQEQSQQGDAREAVLEEAATISDGWNGTNCTHHDENPCCHSRIAYAIGEKIRALKKQAHPPAPALYDCECGCGCGCKAVYESWATPPYLCSACFCHRQPAPAVAQEPASWPLDSVPIPFEEGEK